MTGPGYPPQGPPQGPPGGRPATGGSGGPKIPWGILIVVGLVLLALVVIPLMGRAMSNSPKEWLDDNYDYVSGDVDSSGRLYTSTDDAEQVVAAIDAGTDPDEKRQEGSIYYLRYDSDWLVTVEDEPTGPGTEIRLFEFDAGYRSFGPALFFWSSHYQQGGGSFRGGGSGSGK